jgi:hypothetical protein
MALHNHPGASELSLLEFNPRILEEAEDPNNPILERRAPSGRVIKGLEGHE